MKNSDLILLLIDKSVNAFGQIIGLTEDAKLNVTLTIVQDTIKIVYGIDSNLLTSKALEDILISGQIKGDDTLLLTDLLLTQADILLQLRQPNASLTNYENALHLLHWKTQRSVAIIHLESQSKIVALEAIIETLKPKSNMKNKINCS